MILSLNKLFKIVLCTIGLGIFNTCSFAPQEGVYTEISDFYGIAYEYRSASGYYINSITDNTIAQTIPIAQEYTFNHGGIKVNGQVVFKLAHYCCFYDDKNLSFALLFKRNNQIQTSGIIYDWQQDLGRLFPTDPIYANALFTFDILFDDPTLSTPENHTYAVEVWECLGECAVDDYDLITDKKGEVIINYSLIP